MNQASQPPSYRFGPFVADPAAGELLRKGVRVRIQEQPFRLLCLLLENPGAVVSKESVRQRLWPADTFVEFDASLSVAISKLRDALDDDPENPEFIQTIPRRGYRFIAPIEFATPIAAAPSPTPEAAPAQPAVPEPESKVPAELMTIGPSVAAPPKPLAKLWPAIALLVCAAVIVAIAAGRFRTSSPSAPSSAAENPSAAPPAPIRRSVAVLGFRNFTRPAGR